MQRMTDELRSTSRITIHEGKLDEFVGVMDRCVEIVRTQDPGTIEYAIFINADGTGCCVHERYRDSAAGLAHMANISVMMKQLSKIGSMTGEVCGRPSQELREALESAGVIVYEPLA